MHEMLKPISGRNKKNIISLLSAAVAQRVIKVKVPFIKKDHVKYKAISEKIKEKKNRMPSATF